MKNLLVQFAVVFTLILGFSVSTFAQVDNELKYKAALSVLALEAEGYTILDSDVSLLSKGESYLGETGMYEGYDYKVIAIAGRGVDDLDLYIYDQDANELMKDVDANDGGAAILEFTVNDTDNYVLQAKNHDSRSRYKDYQMAIIVAAKQSYSDAIGYLRL